MEVEKYFSFKKVGLPGVARRAKPGGERGIRTLDPDFAG